MLYLLFIAISKCFNTQPPEGGWESKSSKSSGLWSFQHTAARRRLVQDGISTGLQRMVSTHSRPKAAGAANTGQNSGIYVSTHSRPKAAGGIRYNYQCIDRFQHTAARRRLVPFSSFFIIFKLFQHTAARRRLADVSACPALPCLFQHTAARRRLAGIG